MVKSKNPIGIMQGRLTPTMGRGIQFFPFDTWEKEFDLARKIKLDEIEFIFDLYKYRKNPLWSKKGRSEIIKKCEQTGICIHSICADYFMRKPFFRVDKKTFSANVLLLRKLIKFTKQIGASILEIPLVDNSSVKNEDEESSFCQAISMCLHDLEKHQLTIGLETDLKPRKLIKLTSRINSPRVGITYDSGNSSSLGYDPQEELETYGEKIINVHIKDRVLNGPTVELGTGDTKFNSFFKSLSDLNYTGSFILQVARGADGNESETIKKQMKFLEKWI